MRILYANVIEQNKGWGAEYFVNRGFLKLNHSTCCIDYREHRQNLFPLFLAAPECDVFLLQRGDNFPLSILKAIQLPRFFWASELVSRCRDQDRLLKSGLFNQIFLRTNECLETVVKKGWAERSSLSILLSGFDELVFKPDPDVEKDIDVLFIGSITKRREEILKVIGQTYNVQIVSAFGENMVKWINRAKIILNIHAEDYPDTETRVFEVLGCRGFLLTEKLSPENPFTDDELVQFDTIDDCLSKLSYYLKEQDIREDIANKGYLTAINKHTYTNRASEITKIMLPYIQMNNKPANILRGPLLHCYEIEEVIFRKSELLSSKTRNLPKRMRSVIKKL